MVGQESTAPQPGERAQDGPPAAGATGSALFGADMVPSFAARDAPREPVAVARPRAAKPALLPQAKGTATLLAVDGDSLAYRAFFGYGSAPARDDDDRLRNAYHGFLALLTAICDRVSPDGTVVGFDCHEASVRKTAFPAYKDGRAERDPLLARFVLGAAEVLREVGVLVVVERGWEADDVVASAAAAAEQAGWDCTVATSDRDAFCVASCYTTVLRLKSGLDNAEPVTPARLLEKYGVTPEQYVEYAAMRGDTSDSLDGINGIGPAKAKALLETYGTAEAAAADPLGCRRVAGRKAGQELLDDFASDGSVFRRNKRLMTPRRDIRVNVDDARPRTAADKVQRTLAARGLGSVGARSAAAFGTKPDRPPRR